MYLLLLFYFSGTGTGVFVLCPGFVYTGLMRYSAQKFSWFKKMCFAPIVFLFMRTPKQVRKLKKEEYSLNKL